MTLMINKLIDGKSIALNIREELKLKINQLKEYGITPGLGVDSVYIICGVFVFISKKIELLKLKLR